VSSIPVVDAEREWLIGYDKDARAIVLRFFSEAAPASERDRTEEEHSVTLRRDVLPFIEDAL
jgi:hypothetical protein